MGIGKEFVEHDRDVLAALTAAAQGMAGSRGDSEAETLSLIVSSAVTRVPGAEQAGVSLLRRDGEIT